MERIKSEQQSSERNEEVLLALSQICRLVSSSLTKLPASTHLLNHWYTVRRFRVSLRRRLRLILIIHPSFSANELAVIKKYVPFISNLLKRRKNPYVFGYSIGDKMRRDCGIE